ncbi:MAG TPA: hypothetical protein DCZ73_06180 [Bacteroides sp.]|nr:hypothetical protein [Bacteroides sp.]
MILNFNCGIKGGISIRSCYTRCTGFIFKIFQSCTGVQKETHIQLSASNSADIMQVRMFIKNYVLIFRLELLTNNNLDFSGVIGWISV